MLVSGAALGSETLELASKLSEQPSDKIMLILLAVNLVQILIGMAKGILAAKAKKEDKTEEKIDELLKKFTSLEKEFAVLHERVEDFPTEDKMTEKIMLQLRPQIELTILRTLRSKDF